MFEQLIAEKEGMLEEEDYKRAGNNEKYEKIIKTIKEMVGIATYGNNLRKKKKIKKK